MDFSKILKNKEHEGKEKHIPFIDIVGDENIVRVTVGKEIPHPNTIEHHIVWIELYGLKKDGQVVHLGKANFSPIYTEPDISFRISVKEFKALYALEYCNIHGLWENCIEIE
ncbi:class II SORL domain-containing protein [SCandidatus Aminicenantes bacterium Aminicenantia_JdfR_composite]|jgi:superoxide reductase|nr:class II SORL domain-containing protein [SCandidatus Aminicenantes bacterium Aminicenantia_JdfR_composite]MCP2596245.1 class II SORL domain-containing protein [Candidatus Aminicenantes bacterium AC-335-G13]MCP2597820.1 class II SORL domain-containing protein [Candidatus Aminicenantes bacterium AC-335-L06]MCP2606150.1 class II SORL domain-containing protein [Candidatus Aminicenantes bacterium AC-708-I09]